MGAARLLRGLNSLLDPERLHIVVNTGDDEVFHGLHVSPDIDTVVYTLAGLVSPQQGWGLRDDTFDCLDALGRYYEHTWFRLGDRDLATHIRRTDLLHRGFSLAAVTRHLAEALDVRARVLPMTNDTVRTFVQTAKGSALPFQEYLVRDRGEAEVRGIRLRGIGRARPAPGVLAALRRAHRIVIPPSNPFVSIAPITRLPGVRDALHAARDRVVAVSPLIGDRPVKGPLDRMLRGLGHEVSPVGIATLYRGLAAAFVLDRRDEAYAGRISALGMKPVLADTLMTTPAKSRALAKIVLGALE